MENGSCKECHCEEGEEHSVLCPRFGEDINYPPIVEEESIDLEDELSPIHPDELFPEEDVDIEEEEEDDEDFGVGVI